MKQLMRAVFDFDFTLSCAAFSGAFTAVLLVHMATMQLHYAAVSASCAAVFLIATLYGRKLIKTVLAKYIEDTRR